MNRKLIWTGIVALWIITGFSWALFLVVSPQYIVYLFAADVMVSAGSSLLTFAGLVILGILSLDENKPSDLSSG